MSWCQRTECRGPMSVGAAIPGCTYQYPQNLRKNNNNEISIETTKTNRDYKKDFVKVWFHL